MDTPQQYSAAETERMMKLQDVLLKAMARKIRWWDAAEIIAVRLFLYPLLEKQRSAMPSSFFPHEAISLGCNEGENAYPQGQYKSGQHRDSTSQSFSVGDSEPFRKISRP